MEEEGKEPFFVPGMKNLIETAGLAEPALRCAAKKYFLTKLGLRDKINPSNMGSLGQYIKNMPENEKEVFEKKTGIKWLDFYNGHELVEKMMKGERPNNESASSDIDRDDPFGTI